MYSSGQDSFHWRSSASGGVGDPRPSPLQRRSHPAEVSSHYGGHSSYHQPPPQPPQKKLAIPVFSTPLTLTQRFEEQRRLEAQERDRSSMSMGMERDYYYSAGSLPSRDDPYQNPPPQVMKRLPPGPRIAPHASQGGERMRYAPMGEERVGRAVVSRRSDIASRLGTRPGLETGMGQRRGPLQLGAHKGATAERNQYNRGMGRGGGGGQGVSVLKRLGAPGSQIRARVGQPAGNRGNVASRLGRKPTTPSTPPGFVRRQKLLGNSPLKNKNFNKFGSDPAPKREDLDEELESYMSNTKGYLDRQLDSYMKDANTTKAGPAKAPATEPEAAKEAPEEIHMDV